MYCCQQCNKRFCSAGARSSHITQVHTATYKTTEHVTRIVPDSIVIRNNTPNYNKILNLEGSISECSITSSLQQNSSYNHLSINPINRYQETILSEESSV